MEKEEKLLCSTCGAEIDKTMKFCPSCGEAISMEKAGTTEMIKELANYDSRIFKTVKDLLIRPGSLTIQYIQEKSKAVVAPAKLFLTITAITFVFFSFFGVSTPSERTLPPPLAPGEERPGIDIDFNNNGIFLTNIEYYTEDIESMGVEAFLESREVEKGTINYWVTKKTVEKYKNNQWEQTQNNYERNLSFLMYLLIPVFALVLKVFYVKRSYLEHISFTFYYFTLYFLLQLVFFFLSSLVNLIAPIPVGILLLPVMFVYLVIALHQNYKSHLAISILAGVLSGLALLVMMLILNLISSLLVLSL